MQILLTSGSPLWPRLPLLQSPSHLGIPTHGWAFAQARPSAVARAPLPFPESADAQTWVYVSPCPVFPRPPLPHLTGPGVLFRFAIEHLSFSSRVFCRTASVLPACLLHRASGPGSPRAGTGRPSPPKVPISEHLPSAHTPVLTDGRQSSSSGPGVCVQLFRCMFLNLAQ